RYALVHRYSAEPIVDPETNEIIGEHLRNPLSERLIRDAAACLRLIRPMRQRTFMMAGGIRDEDGSFDVTRFDVPTHHLVDVPEVQKLFSLRNRDADDLRAYMPNFRRAMQG